MRERLRAAIEAVRAHPRHAVLLALVAGLLAGGWAPAAVLVAAPLAAWLGGRTPLGAVAAAAVLAGAGLADARRDAIDAGRLPAAIGSRLASELTLLEPFRERTSGERVARAEVRRGWAAGETLLLRWPRQARFGGAPPRHGAGTVVAVTGRLVGLRRWDEVQRRRGALAAIDVASLRATGARRGGVPGALDGVRRRAEAALEAGLPDREASLVRGMVLGQDDAVDAGTREAFRRSGLSHLLAASGMNVMLLAMLVLAAGAAVGAPVRLRLAVAIVLIVLYVPVAGAGPSIQRAGVMGAAGLVAALAGRPASRWYAVGLAAAATLALNPYAAAEPGWQLSFAALLGLMAWSSRIRLGLRRHGVPALLAEPAAVTLAATLATAPLLAAHFEQVSLASLPANLLAVPAVAPVMWLGTLTGLAAQCGLVTPLSWMAGLFASWIGLVADAAARLPLATLDVGLGPAAVLVAYLALALAPVAWRGSGRRLRRLTGGGRRPTSRAGLVVAGVALLAAGLALPPGRSGAAPLAPGETRVSFLDVGQGDATLVQRGASSILFDTGPPDGPVSRRLAEAGVRRLEVLVVTHAQADHEGAALEVVRRFRPRLVVDGGAGWPTEVQRRLPAEASEAGARLVRAVRGDVLRAGGLEVRVLWPPRALAEAPPEGDPNDRALVAAVRSGRLDVLLTADAESHVTNALPLSRVDVLKVAHHGSADEGLSAFLDRTRPVVAAVMVGRGNPYGHPAPSTLRALAGVPVVRRTDRHGTVRVRAHGAGLAVETDGAGLR